MLLRRTPVVVAGITLVALAALGSSADAAKLREVFPEFEAREGTLGPVALLADLVVIRQEGGTPVLRRPRSALYSDSIPTLVRAMLEGKGLAVRQARLASMGITFGEQGPAGVAGSRDGGRRREGVETIALVRLSVWDVPIGKQLASLFDFSTPNVARSRAFLGLTVVSGADGLILWDERYCQEKSLKLEALRERVDVIARHLPQARAGSRRIGVPYPSARTASSVMMRPSRTRASASA